MRFSSCKENEHDSENDGESEDGSSSTYQKFTGSPDQITYVNNCLCEHGLHFILPWIHQMIPFHQDILRRTVFHVNRVKGKGRYHALPDEMFLDRREVNVDISDLYCNDKIQPFHRKDLQAEQSAHHSIDCSADQLQMLLEMLLSFHAAYKYGSSLDEADFEKNVKLMMKYIKNWVRRGNETKNWSISKFHELLHLPIDARNFGSLANVDAGKGESGLKVWAKLPAKTVRTRSADKYYMDNTSVLCGCNMGPYLPVSSTKNNM